MTLIRFANGNTKPAFSNLLEDFFRTDGNDYLFDGKGTLPAVNIHERKQDFLIEVAAPGFAKENFEVKVENKLLIIQGNKDDNQEENKDGFSRREFSYKSFQRAFYLPKNADVNRIEGKYKDGILQITVARKEEAKENPVRSISIS